MKNLRTYSLFALVFCGYFLLAYPARTPEYQGLMFLTGVLMLGVFGFKGGWWLLAVPMMVAAYFYPYLGQGQWVWLAVGGMVILYLARHLLWSGIIRLYKGKPEYGRRHDDHPRGPRFDHRRNLPRRRD